jgi:hypothetical protein
MSTISTSADSPERATRSISRVERELELAAVGEAGQRVAAGQVAQPVDHRLQPRQRAAGVSVGSAWPACVSSCKAACSLSVCAAGLFS